MLSFAVIITLVAGAGSGGLVDQTAPPAPFPDQAERLELYRQLVASIRKYHVFAPLTELNLGRKWAEDLPRIEKEFAEARTIGPLRSAIHHLQNSLHNRHCSYNTPDRPETLVAGFRAEVEWAKGRPVFYVAEVTDQAAAREVAEGDLVTEVDGVPSGRFMDAFSLESRANNVRGLAGDIATFLGTRRTLVNDVSEGQSLSVRFKRRSGGGEYSATFTWRRPPESPDGPGSEWAIDYASSRCADLPERDYGPYALSSTGINYCVYTAPRPPYSAYPIVRHFSFYYQGATGEAPVDHVLRVERRTLERDLAALSGAKGVILDLRDNHGGNNPNWFFDWWAPGPYVDHFVDVRLHDDFSDITRLKAARPTGWQDADYEAYQSALRARSGGQDFMKRRPFFCKPDGCDWDNRYVPRHQVTKLPLALLVGPLCISACDELAQVFSENRFAPLVGESPAAAFTVFRIELPVRLPRTKLDLGFMRLAFSREVSGKSGKEVEGRMLKVDYPVEPSFPNRKKYDALLVDAAVKALAGSAVEGRR